METIIIQLLFNKKRGGLNQTVNRFHNNVCNFMQQDDCSTNINQLGKQY